MSARRRIAFVSVVPSPYQRDLFAALAARPEVDLNVFYMERSAPDSPWPDQPLAPYEHHLPGFWLPIRHARVHCNWRLPHPRDYDLIVCNTLMSLTGQWLMRWRLRGNRWIFWGEKLGRRSSLHDQLTAPLNHAAAIAAIGTWAERDYAARFPNSLIFNIPYHCTLAPFRDFTRPEQNSDRVTFLFCGQMIARKGLDHLLTAFAQLPPNAHLLLVGREAELPTLLGTLPSEVQKRVEFAGFQRTTDLPALFARSDVFVLPSRYDGWGVVVNQALAAGLPILVSDQVGAGYDLVARGENGNVFPVGDVQTLAGQMQELFARRNLMVRWGAASRTRSYHWDPEDGADRWVHAISHVLA